jgi:GxxExxY protein
VDKLVFKGESYQIIGVCFEVHREMGSGFLEAVYQECLSLEMTKQNISFAEKPKLALQYKGCGLKQSYEPDFLCMNEIVLEIKAVKNLTDEHRAQVINYLKATKKKLGLLVNFGSGKLEHERFVNVKTAAERETTNCAKVANRE